jgi:alkylation response protein AidB-like acyl-CoA dehydrogenase
MTLLEQGAGGGVQADLAGTVAGARAAAAVLRANAAATEQAGRPVEASLEALRGAGSFRMTTPLELGGLGADAGTVVAAVRELGRACPASAWLVALTNSVKVLLPAMSEAAAAAIGSSADTPVVENFTPGTLRATGDGHVLSGTWRYASGSEVARHAVLAALEVDESGRPSGMGLAVVPVDRLRLERSWDVAGLQGTGSHTLVAEDLVVPAGFVLALPQDPDLPGTNVLRTAMHTTAALVGMATGALDVGTELITGEKAPTATRYARYAESPGARALYAEARQLVRTASARVDAVASVFTARPDLGAVGGSTLPVVTRLTLREDLVLAAREARQAVDLLIDLHGSSAFARTNPLQRFWRDLSVGSRHAGLRRFTVEEDLARALAGGGEFGAVVQ